MCAKSLVSVFGGALFYSVSFTSITWFVDTEQLELQHNLARYIVF